MKTFIVGSGTTIQPEISLDSNSTANTTTISTSTLSKVHLLPEDDKSQEQSYYQHHSLTPEDFMNNPGIIFDDSELSPFTGGTIDDEDDDDIGPNAYVPVVTE